MKLPSEIASEAIDGLYRKLNNEAEKGGYHLNPDSEFTRDLIRSLIINDNRYGYWACPCRLASGDKAEDLDIICPCDYRDSDLSEYDACYCALYVSQRVIDGEKQALPIPERRPPEEIRKKKSETSGLLSPLSQLSFPVWRCKVCGYLCARDGPPEICPVCRAKKERFERFI